MMGWEWDLWLAAATLDFGSDLAHNVDTGIFPLRDTSNAEAVLKANPAALADVCGLRGILF